MVDFRNRVLESIKSGRAIRLSDKQRWCVAFAAIKLTAGQVDALEAENAQTVAETEEAEVAEATEAVEAEAEEVEGVETASAGEGGTILSGWGRTQKKKRGKVRRQCRAALHTSYYSFSQGSAKL